MMNLNTLQHPAIQPALFGNIGVEIEARRPSTRFKMPSFADCSHAWSYLGKINIASRNLFSAAAAYKPIVNVAGADFPSKVKNLTTHMKLLAIVSVPFTLSDMKGTGQKIMDSVKIKDYQGTGLSTLSFSIMSLDVIDSATTFVNSALRVSSLAPIGLFSAVGMPLGASMSSLGTVSRTISLSKSTPLIHGIHTQRKKTASDADHALLKAFLEKKLGVDQVQRLTASLASDPENAKNVRKIKHMKARMKAAILRSAPQDAVKELEKLHELLTQNTGNTSPELQKEIDKSLSKAKSFLMKKMWADALSIMANISTLTALTLFFVGNATPVPFLLLALAFSIRVGVVAFQDYNKRVN